MHIYLYIDIHLERQKRQQERLCSAFQSQYKDFNGIYLFLLKVGYIKSRYLFFFFFFLSWEGGLEGNFSEPPIISIVFVQQRQHVLQDSSWV